MRIQHNIQAIRAQRQTSINSNNASKSLEKLSSGFAINRAADGAASLAISEKMRSQIRGLERATSNAQDSISLMQTAEGALQETQSILQRMRELSVQSANGIYQSEDREKINDELGELSKEITRISENTNFNNIKVLSPEYTLSGGDVAGKFSISGNVPAGSTSLTVKYDSTADEFQVLDGTDIISRSSGTIDENDTFKDGDTISLSGGITLTNISGADHTPGASADLAASSISSNSFSFQIGTTSSESISLTVENMSAESLGVAVGTNTTGTDGREINVSTVDEANKALTKIDSAISQVSKQRAKLGSTQNRIEHAINNLGVSVENITAAESRIRDVDMAKEMMNFTKNNILMQASQSMLAQANAQPQSVLQLLG